MFKDSVILKSWRCKELLSLKKGYDKERAIPGGVSVLMTEKTNRLCIHQVLKKKLAATDHLMFLPTANSILVLLAV